MEEKITPRDLYMRCGPTIDITEAEEYIGSDLYESIIRGLKEAIASEETKRSNKVMKDRDKIDSFYYIYESVTNFLEEQEDHIVSEHIKELENFASLPLYPIDNEAAAQDQPKN